MKKTITLSLALLLLLTACAGQPSPEQTDPSTSEMQEQTTEATTEAPTEESTEAPTEAETNAPTEETTEATTEAPTEPEEGLMGTVVNTASLNVRAEANAECEILGTLVAGSRVEVFEQIAVNKLGWGRITYNGSPAWVCMKYVRLDTAPEIPTEPHVHDYSFKEVIAATCTANGYTRYTCECGEYYDAAYTDVKGHDLGEWIVTKEATATESGIMERHCSRCSEVETKVIPATGE